MGGARLESIAYSLFFKADLKLGNKVDGILDSGDRGGLFFWDFGVEFFFDGHDQFNGIEGVGTEVIDEGGFGDDLVGINTKLLNNDVLDLGFELGGHEESSTLSSGDEGRRRSEGGSSGNKGKGDDGLEHGKTSVAIRR